MEEVIINLPILPVSIFVFATTDMMKTSAKKISMLSFLPHFFILYSQYKKVMSHRGT